MLVASKLPLRRREVVPMMDGHSAFIELVLESGQLVRAYSVHLSVRCSPSKRYREVKAVLSHLQSGGGIDIIAGKCTFKATPFV